LSWVKGGKSYFILIQTGDKQTSPYCLQIIKNISVKLAPFFFLWLPIQWFI